MTALQKEVEEIDKQVAEAERMLKFADPGVPPATPTVMCRQRPRGPHNKGERHVHACLPCRVARPREHCG